MRKLIPLLLLSLCLATVKIDLTGYTRALKIVNGDYAYEVAGTIATRLTEIIPIVYQDDLLTQIIYGTYFGLGFSQGYTGPRSQLLAMNHAGVRTDFSIGAVFGDFELIYTHSARNWYSGADQNVYFFYDDVDSLMVRYKTTLEF